MSKRISDEVLCSAVNGAAAASLQPVMTADSEPKKAKLDPTAAAFYSSPYLLPMPQLLAGAPLTTMPGGSAGTTTSTLNPVCLAPITMSSCNNGINQMQSSGPLSRVVHIRNLPPDMTDVELLQLCLQYARVTNYMMLKGKSQAFVEYESEAGAASFVNAMNSIPIQVRGRTIFAQYSTHQELKLDKGRPPAGIAEQENSANIANGSSMSSLDMSAGTQQAPNCVLRVIIENMIYPVTLDVLYSLFSRYGKVLRIITFSKNNTFQALIQISEATAAQTAKQSLDNQNVYNGCCTLRIDYSKLSTLNVKYNNDKSRDYTNPNLPSGEISLEQQLAISAIPGLQSLLPQAAPFSYSFGAANANSLFTQAAAAAVGAEAQALNPFVPSLGTIGTSISPALSTLRFPVGILAPTNVILVSNLDENKVTPDGLFTLFGVYGDVVRVKILYNKKDNALIQYSEPQQAQLAIQHLDKVRWHDRLIRVTASRHTAVQMPKEGQPDAGLTRDYTHSPLHRFKKPGSKNYMNIYPPSSTLHLSNIPPSISEQTLTEAFQQNGFAVKGFKFFPKDHKMALCQLEDVDAAINALIVMHNHRLAESSHLRVSFSKSAI